MKLKYFEDFEPNLSDHIAISINYIADLKLYENKEKKLLRVETENNIITFKNSLLNVDWDLYFAGKNDNNLSMQITENMSHSYNISFPKKYLTKKSKPTIKYSKNSNRIRKHLHFLNDICKHSNNNIKKEYCAFKKII